MGGTSALPPGWLLVSQPSLLPLPASPSSQLSSSLGEPPPSLGSQAGTLSPGLESEDPPPWDSSLEGISPPPVGPGGLGELGELDEPGGLGALGGAPGVEGGMLDGLGNPPLEGDGMLGGCDCGPGGGVMGAMHAVNSSTQPAQIRIFAADMKSPSTLPVD